MLAAGSGVARLRLFKKRSERDAKRFGNMPQRHDRGISLTQLEPSKLPPATAQSPYNTF